MIMMIQYKNQWVGQDPGAIEHLLVMDNGQVVSEKAVISLVQRSPGKDTIKGKRDNEYEGLIFNLAMV